MKPQRLWPVTTSLIVILGGALALEAAAKQRGTATEVIQIADASVSEDEVEAGGDEEWVSSEPRDEAHGRARTFARRGDYEQAAKLLAEVVQRHPQDNELLAEYGHVLRRADRLDEALAMLERARSETTRAASIDVDEGWIYRARGEQKEALAAFARAAKTRPRHTPTILAYGMILREMKRYDEARTLLERASKFGSNDERARALTSLGRVLAEQEEFAEAADVFRRASQRAPAMTSVWLLGARAMWSATEAEHKALALRFAINATKLVPGLASAHSVLGRTFEHLDRPDDAAAAYERAVTVDDRYEYPRERLVRLALAQEDYRAARQHVVKLLEISPREREYLFLAGLVESGAGNYTEARDRFRAAAEAAKKPDPEAWYNLGLVERRLENYDASVEAYRVAIELRPDYKAAFNNLGLTLSDREQVDEAEASFRRAIALDGDYAAAWSNLARLYARLGRHAEAITAYERLVVLRPADLGARMRYAIELRRGGRPEDSIAQYEKLIAEQPRYVAGLYNLAIAYNSAGREDDAERTYKRALQLDPSHTRAMKNLGILLARQQRYAEAVGQLQNALDHEPGDVVVRYRLARSLNSLGQHRRCADEARRVLAQDPEHRARALLDECSSPDTQPPQED